jgi:phosphate transport system permease protein
MNTSPTHSSLLEASSVSLSAAVRGSSGSMKRLARRRKKDVIFRSLLLIFTVISLIPLVSVFFFVLYQGVPHLGISFFTELPKPVGETGGGLGNAVLGTLTLLGLSTLVGIPIGLITGIYLSEMKTSRLAETVRTSVEMLSGVPSIVLGIFAYSAVVVPVGHFSALAGAFALAVIQIPLIAKTTEEVLKLVPVHIREAGLALGLPRWRVTLSIVLAGSRSGVITGIVLALARIAGETAPLLFTALNSQHWGKSVFEPISSLPVQIYAFALAPFEEWNHLAWAGASFLIILISGSSLVLRLFAGRK